MRSWAFFISLCLVGCGSSHSPAAPVDGGLDDEAAPDGSLFDVIPDAAAEVGPQAPLACEPQLLELVGEPCFCQGAIAVWNGYLYRQDIEIGIYSLEDPLRPRRVGTLPSSPVSSGNMFAIDGRLYVSTDFDDYVRTYDLSDPAAPTEGPTMFIGGTATHMDIRAGVGVVAYQTPSEAMVGVFDPPSLRMIDSRPLGERAYDVRIAEDGRHAYVRWYDGTDTRIDAIENGEPGFGQLVLEETHPFGIAMATVDEALMLIGDSLWFFDRESGALLSEEPGRFERPNNDIWMQGELAFVGGSALQILDLSDRTSPRTVATLEGMSARHLAVNGDVAYLSNGNGTYPVDLNCD